MSTYVFAGPWEQRASLANKQLPIQLWTKVDEDSLEDVLFVQKLRTEEQTGNAVGAPNVCVQGPLRRDKWNKMWQLPRTITMLTVAKNNHNADKRHSHNSVLDYVFLSTNILCIKFHKEWKTRINVIFCLSVSLGIKFRKKNLEKMITKYWYKKYSKSRKFCSIFRGLSYSLSSFLHSPVTSSLLDPNILLNTQFSNTLSLRSSLNVSNQVSHPYKTTGKIIVLHILTSTFLESKLGDQRFSTE